MGRAVPPALKKTIVIAALGWFIAGGIGAVMALDANQSDRPVSISVDRTNKGDRLSTVSTAKARVNAPATTVSRTAPPLGCDPAFSKVAEPQKAHIFGRCAA
jgi:hypothetical protein